MTAQILVRWECAAADTQTLAHKCKFDSGFGGIGMNISVREIYRKTHDSMFHNVGYSNTLYSFWRFYNFFSRLFFFYVSFFYTQVQQQMFNDVAIFCSYSLNGAVSSLIFKKEKSCIVSVK